MSLLTICKKLLFYHLFSVIHKYPTDIHWTCFPKFSEVHWTFRKNNLFSNCCIFTIVTSLFCFIIFVFYIISIIILFWWILHYVSKFFYNILESFNKSNQNSLKLKFSLKKIFQKLTYFIGLTLCFLKKNVENI